jgi:hypothetical protein
MKPTMPAVWNLLAISLTVTSGLTNASLYSPGVLHGLDTSSSLRHLSANIFSCSSRVSAWELIDTKTGTKVMDLVNDTIVYVDQPSFSIRAVTSGSGTLYVRLTLNGGYTNTEKAAPYALCTNMGSVYRRCDGLTHGKHVVTGSACCDRGGIENCQHPPTALAFEIRTNAPSNAPLQTRAPIMPLTKAPAKAPTTNPTEVAAVAPTKDPTNGPTKAPTEAPIMAPTEASSKVPTKAPMALTKVPLEAPTKAPSEAPTKAPNQAPSKAPVSNYNIQLGLSGNVTTDDRSIFELAAAKWQSIITGDLANANTSRLSPRNDGCQWPSVIDDLFICVAYRAIDGPSKVLGYASPEQVRKSDGLPASGKMVFDLADLTFLRSDGGGKFLNTILHEMGHVLGT